MKNSTQIWRRAIAVFTLLVMASTGVIAGQPKKDKKGVDEIVADVLRAPRSSNEINSPADSPVTILDSNSTEISRSTLRKLTGTETSAAKAVSYPQVTLLNNSDRAVKEVLLLLTNNATGTRTRLKVGGINIAPHETYVVEREKWMVPALIGVKSPKAGEQPRTLSMKDVLRYDSNRAWMLGGAADLSVMVALANRTIVTDGTSCAGPRSATGIRRKPNSSTRRTLTMLLSPSRKNQRQSGASRRHCHLLR